MTDNFLFILVFNLQKNSTYKKNRIHSLKETEIEFDDSEMLSDFLEYLKSELNNLYSISKSNFNDRKRVIDKYIDTLEIRRINDKEYDINCNFVLDLELETKEKNLLLQWLDPFRHNLRPPPATGRFLPL